MSRIVRVICPHCQDRDMNYNPQVRAFECHECIFRYPADWFNVFKTFEHLVTRVDEIETGRPVI